MAKLEQVLNIMPPEIATQSVAFFNYILSKKFPFDLFNDSKITRCSSFRIKGLKRGGQAQLSEQLIAESDICAWNLENPVDTDHIPSSIKELTKYSDTLYKEYIDSYGGQIKPGHEQILTGILMNIDNSIAVEVPIWTRRQSTLKDFTSNKKDQFSFTYKNSITGHIDLLMYNEKTQSLTVADYKPEGHFLKSLPQVATYGLILQRILKIKDVKCVSFNKEGLWYYDPNILKTSIEEGLLEYPDLKLKWRKYVRNL